MTKLQHCWHDRVLFGHAGLRILGRVRPIGERFHSQLGPYDAIAAALCGRGAWAPSGSEKAAFRAALQRAPADAD